MKRSPSIRRIFIFLIALFAMFQASIAQKTDKVLFKNGDVLTGEIRKLDLDILQFKTSTMRTVNIKWYLVSSLIAPDKDFLVELRDGTKIFGSLDTAKLPNTLRIMSKQGEFNISKDQVIMIIQVKQIFWNKFSGNFKAGVNYTKAANVLQRNLGAGLTFTDEGFYAGMEYSGIGTTQQDTIYAAKQDFTINFNQEIRKFEFTTVFGNFQQNTELGINLRSGGGLGYGLDMIHTSVARFRGLAAITGNRENVLGESNNNYNIEGLVRADLKIFKYESPEMFVNAFANWYPSFTVDGRHRFEAELQFNIEIVNNLYIEFRVYTNNDNKPVSEAASSNDWGIISSLSYTFGL